MIAKFIEKTPYQKAFAAWFSDYDRARRALRRRPGACVPEIPPPPTCPEDISVAVDLIGRSKVLSILGIHRCTLARWLSGASVIPRPCWLVLALWSQGRLPGMSADWQDFRFDGDRLCIVGTRLSYSAREISGWSYQQAHSAALARQVAGLQSKIDYLLQIGRFEAQNDALMNTR